MGILLALLIGIGTGHYLRDAEQREIDERVIEDRPNIPTDGSVQHGWAESRAPLDDICMPLELAAHGLVLNFHHLLNTDAYGASDQGAARYERYQSLLRIMDANGCKYRPADW